MSENYEYCNECGKIARRIGLDDEPNEYAICDECVKLGDSE